MTNQPSIKALKTAADKADSPLFVPLGADYFDVKPTPWLARGLALRRGVTNLQAKGGVGKTQLLLQCAVAFMEGEDFAGFHPMRSGIRTGFIVGEEDVEEMERRLMAVVIHRVGDNEKAVNVYMHKVRRHIFIRPGKIVALVAKGSGRGAAVVETNFHRKLLDALAAEQKPFDLLVLDPMSRLHSGLDENSAEMQALHNAADQLAIAGDCGVVIVRHNSKAMKDNVDDQGAGRGTSALVDAARLVVSMAGMTPEEAQDLLPANQQSTFVHYCKINDPKQNYDAKSGNHRWFFRQTVKLPVLLEDRTPDSRFVLVPWKPDDAMDLASAPWLAAFLDAIKRGPEEGELYSTSSTNGKHRAEKLLEDFGVPKKQRRAALDRLCKQGMVKVVRYNSKRAKREVFGYQFVSDTPMDVDHGHV